MVPRCTLPFLFLLSALAPPLACGQFNTTLEPRTIEDFQQYTRKIERQISARWNGERPFLSIDESPSDRNRVMRGEVVTLPASPEDPVPVSNGLIHDWVGDVFIPNTSMQKVLNVLEDYDRHSRIYPEIIDSRLLRRNGNDITGYWRLERKDPLLAVVLDLEQESHYQEIAPGKWICRAYANKISEIENAGTSREKRLPPGQGQGFLWRMYVYWTLESLNGGVLAECRTLSLSRSVPPALTWVIKPFIQNLPRESLAGTLRLTREAAQK